MRGTQRSMPAMATIAEMATMILKTQMDSDVLVDGKALLSGRMIERLSGSGWGLPGSIVCCSMSLSSKESCSR